MVTEDSGLKNFFESLLNKTVEDVRTASKIGPIQSSRDFEKTVYNALCSAAEGTKFEEKISETSETEFPDIVAGELYGVEVKRTKSKRLTTSGNSIFEQTRDDMVKFIYIVIGNRNDVVWRRYEETLEKIVVTHSPRYLINANASTTVFEEMGISYDAFRNLDQQAKMDRVRPLYAERSLWWLSQAVTTQPIRFFSSLSRKERDFLAAKSMILCPEIFDKSRPHKYQRVSVIALSMGVVVPNVRDLFSAGGRESMDGQEYPQVFKRAVGIQVDLRNALGSLEIEQIEEFWECAAKKDFEDRWQQWIGLVDESNECYKISNLID